MDFNTAASSWDTPMRIARAKIIAEKIAVYLPALPHMDALEFGCGTGLVSFFLCDRFHEIALVDSSREMINMVNSKITQAVAGSMRAYHTDLLDGSVVLQQRFDIIYSSMALHHIVDIQQFVSIFHNLLQKDGCLYIVDLDQDDGSFHRNEPGFIGHNGFDQPWLRALLQDNGFRDVTSETFYVGERDNGSGSMWYSLFILSAVKQ